MNHDQVGLVKGKGEFWMETYTGKVVHPLHMTEKDIDIKDIAHHLSLTCRFNGGSRVFYSVGQHSLHVCRIIDQHLIGEGNRSSWSEDEFQSYRITMLAGILHDGAEAYTGDISRPFKYGFRGLKELDNHITGLIMKKYGAVGADWNYIKKADDIALAIEARKLVHSGGKGWSLPEVPEGMGLQYALFSRRDTEVAFMRTFDELVKTDNPYKEQ